MQILETSLVHLLRTKPPAILIFEQNLFAFVSSLPESPKSKPYRKPQTLRITAPATLSPRSHRITASALHASSANAAAEIRAVEPATASDCFSSSFYTNSQRFRPVPTQQQRFERLNQRRPATASRLPSTPTASDSDQMKMHFMPEFLDRLDVKAIFKPLSHDQLREVVRLQMQDVINCLVERGTALAVSDAALDYALSQSYDDPTYEARPIRRWLEMHVVTELEKMLIREEIDENSTVNIDAAAGGKVLSYHVEKNGGL